MLISFSKGMENNIARYNASVENGKKGGRPPKSQNLPEEQESKHNLEKPSKTQENLQEPTHNLNVNVNVNDNVNDIKLVKENKINIFDSYERAGACERVPQRTVEERKPYLTYYRDYFDWCFSDHLKNVGLEIIDTMIEAKEQALAEKGLQFKQKKYNFHSFVSIVGKVDCDKFRSIITQVAFNEEIEHRPIYILGCIITAAESSNCKVSQKEFEKFIAEVENAGKNLGE